MKYGKITQQLLDKLGLKPFINRWSELQYVELDEALGIEVNRSLCLSNDAYEIVYSEQEDAYIEKFGLDDQEIVEAVNTKIESLEGALFAKIQELENKINSNPSPEPSNLIPDEWTQQQRLAAMRELMDEYRSHEESN